jgi:predicted dehydrogenase
MRIGFIGVGGIASNYLRSLARLRQPVAAICDVDQDRAVAVAQQQNAKAYGDHREMLERERLDAIFTCIPPGAHTTEVADAATARAAVFVAKPVALDLETALRTQEAIERSGVINQAGYMARYSDITERARTLTGDRPIALGFGRFLCRMSPSHPWWGKFSMSGGQIVEQSTHVFDLLRHFLGEVDEVHAFGHRGAGADIADFEDSTVCNLRFSSGAVGNVTSTCVSRAAEGFAVELSGRDLHLRLTLDTRLIGQIDGEPIEYTGEETGYYRQVEYFLRAVRQKDPSLVRSFYSDAVRTLALTLAVNRSLQSGEVEAVTEAVLGETVSKVIAYVTRERDGEIELMVYDYPDDPEAGLQVPAFGVTPGGEVSTSVLERVVEESGLQDLALSGCLVTYPFWNRAKRRRETHYVFHLEAPAGAPDDWKHAVAGTREGAEMVFVYRWMRLPEAAARLTGGQGDHLHLLREGANQ